MVKIGRLDDFFWPQASPVKGQSLQQKEKKENKGKGGKIKNRFLRMP